MGKEKQEGKDARTAKTWLWRNGVPPAYTGQRATDVTAGGRPSAEGLKDATKPAVAGWDLAPIPQSAQADFVVRPTNPRAAVSTARQQAHPDARTLEKEGGVLRLKDAPFVQLYERKLGLPHAEEDCSAGDGEGDSAKDNSQAAA